MIDIGANLGSTQLYGRLPELLAGARHAGLSGVIGTGTSLVVSRTVAGLAADHPGFITATAGVHPHAAKEWTAHVEREIRHLLELPAVVAVGECGLDYNRMFSPKEVQRIAFEAQLQIAADVGKPLFLHCRDAFPDFLAMLKVAGCPKGVVHCFTGGVDEAKAYLDAGYDLGITGWVCDERRGGELRKAVAFAPLARLHLETDAPYLMPRNAPVSKDRKKPNVPANLPWVAKTVAALQDTTLDVVAATTAANSLQLFGLPGSRSVQR